jgi:hypothetical protein
MSVCKNHRFIALMMGTEMMPETLVGTEMMPETLLVFAN